MHLLWAWASGSALSQDLKGLTEIWTEDAVRFSPQGPAVGNKAIEVQNREMHQQYPGFKVTRYVPKFGDLQIEGDLASV